MNSKTNRKGNLPLVQSLEQRGKAFLADYPARVLDILAYRLACACGKLGIALKAREQPRLLLPGAPASGADHNPGGGGLPDGVLGPIEGR